MLNFWALKPRVKGGPRPPGPPWIRAWEADTPPESRHPPTVHAGRYEQQAGVRMLLECILVSTHCWK